MSEVQARDIFSLLIDRLKPIDRVILGQLAEGLRVCDIAEKLKVSHVFVVQHRPENENENGSVLMID